MLESLIPLATAGMQMPLQYGALYNNAFQPYYGFLGAQANNMAQLGGQGVGAYTNLMGQQSAERQAAMPLQLQAQQFNAIAPVLSGLLGQFFPGLGSIGPINFGGGGAGSRDGGVSGLQRMMDQAYSRAGSYDQQFANQFNRNIGMLPTAPYMSPQAAKASAPAQPAAMAPPAAPKPPAPRQPETPNPVRYYQSEGKMRQYNDPAYGRTPFADAQDTTDWQGLEAARAEAMASARPGLNRYGRYSG